MEVVRCPDIPDNIITILMMMVTVRLQCRAFLVAGQINTTNCQADKRLSIYQPLSWIAIPQTKQPNLFLSLNIPTSFLDCITTDETNQALLQPDVTFGYSARMHAAYYAVHST